MRALRIKHKVRVLYTDLKFEGILNEHLNAMKLLITKEVDCRAEVSKNPNFIVPTSHMSHREAVMEEEMVDEAIDQLVHTHMCIYLREAAEQNAAR